MSCSPSERLMPRRAPSKVRADLRTREVAKRHCLVRKTSQLLGLSPHGRAVLAGLECTRLWPGAAEEALRYWTAYIRDPYARRWDRADSCHVWECCPDIDQVHGILRIVMCNLPKPDARRLRATLKALGDNPSRPVITLSPRHLSGDRSWFKNRRSGWLDRQAADCKHEGGNGCSAPVPSSLPPVSAGKP